MCVPTVRGAYAPRVRTRPSAIARARREALRISSPPLFSAAERGHEGGTPCTDRSQTRIVVRIGERAANTCRVSPPTLLPLPLRQPHTRAAAVLIDELDAGLFQR